MINVSVGTATRRVRTVVDEGATLYEIFENEGVTTDGALIYFNGKVINDGEVTIGSLELKESGNTLSAIVKASSAM